MITPISLGIRKKIFEYHNSKNLWNPITVGQISFSELHLLTKIYLPHCMIKNRRNLIAKKKWITTWYIRIHFPCKKLPSTFDVSMTRSSTTHQPKYDFMTTQIFMMNLGSFIHSLLHACNDYFSHVGIQLSSSIHFSHCQSFNEKLLC